LSRWPDDPTAYRPSARWLGIVVVAVMLGIFALIGTWMWMGAHHSSLVSQVSGDWTSSSAKLLVYPETRAYQYSATESRTRETGDLLVKGSIGGHEVSGRVSVSDFPPWGASVSTTLLGRTWTLRAEGEGQRLALIDDDGRVTILTRAQ
jgi:hypothetical protein